MLHISDRRPRLRFS